MSKRATVLFVAASDVIANTDIPDDVTHVLVERAGGGYDAIELKGVLLALARTWGELVSAIAAGPRPPRRTRGGRPKLAVTPEKPSATPPRSRGIDQWGPDGRNSGPGAIEFSGNISFEANTSFEEARFEPADAILESAAAPAAAAPASMPEVFTGSAPEAPPPADAPPPAGAPGAPQSTPVTTVKTAINAEFENHPKAEPLQVGTDYVLAFFAGQATAATVASSAEMDVQFAGEEKSVRLTIQVVSDSFEIQQSSADLVVKRDGRSAGKARFDLRPLKDGACTIEAMILRDGNFVQKLTIATNVGTGAAEAVVEKSVGRAITADEVVHPRNISILITEEVGGLRVIATKDGATAGHLTIGSHDLKALADEIRKQLQEAVESFDDQSASFAYQKGLTIPEDLHQATLKELAKVGTFVFKRLFGPGSGDPGMRAIGKLLKDTIDGPALDLQIVTSRFFVPWPLLYIEEKPNAPVDANRFLGFAHRVEEIAIQSTAASKPEISHKDSALRIGVNVNEHIDSDMDATFVSDQLAFFTGVALSNQATVNVRRDTDTVRQAIADPKLPDQIMYFYCHAVSDHESPTQSGLQFESDRMLTLMDIGADAPEETFESTPLVVINACQSAMLSPLLYDGFVPTMIKRGARGVIGTECDTPAIFAADWAERFFREFLNGRELGKVVHGLRRHYLEKERNVMGLLYAVHCNGNTRVDPSLGLTAS